MTDDMAAPIAVTGSTGALGSRVARRLAAEGVRQRLVVRDPGRAPVLRGSELAVAEYRDGPAMRKALDGVETVLLVSASESEDRVDEHLTAVESAREAGVQRIVYTSFLGAGPESTFTLARHHWATEQAIRGSGMAFTFLRDSMYADFVPFMVDGEDRVIRGPGGDGRVSLVARDDVASVAEAVLLAGGAHDGLAYDVTGPQALTLQEVADILGDVTGRPVGYEVETVEEAFRSRERYGAPDWEVEGWVSTYTAIAAGELALVSGDVEAVTGHPPAALRDLMAAHPESWAHLT
jgi:NAD(P)H dehydrogenase (quinone)